VSAGAVAERRPHDRTAASAPGTFTVAVRGVRLCALVAYRLLPAALVAFVLRAAGRRSLAGRYFSRRLVALLQELGPVFVKIGQILGTRRDVLPAALCDELRLLHDAVEPMSPADARASLAELYDAAAGNGFRRLDERPVASGSIACVYRALLEDGSEVAVKLQRPGIHAVVARDLALVSGVMRRVARLRPFRGVPLEGLVADVARAIHGQLDFAAESTGLERLRASLTSVPRVWVPRLERQLCRDRAIVMEYIPGLEAGPLERFAVSAARRFARSALTAVYEMLFVDGFVHCDLHPGNLYFTDSGQVVILDAGFSVQLSDRLRRLFAEFFMNMSLGRGDRCAEIVVQSASAVRPDADLAAFSTGLADLVERNSRVPAKDFSLIAFATEMFELQRRFGLTAATELVFPLLSLLVVEGTVRALDPELDFQEIARPVLTRGVFAASAQR
jgi:ubiquinone biosynthesis protein